MTCLLKNSVRTSETSRLNFAALLLPIKVNSSGQCKQREHYRRLAFRAVAGQKSERTSRHKLFFHVSGMSGRYGPERIIRVSLWPNEHVILLTEGGLVDF